MVSKLHRILIPELLTNVLSSLEANRDLYSTSLVCSSWSDLSLDVLWRTMESVLPLLKALAPMAESAELEWFFPDSLVRPKWARFDAYARRIRILKHSDANRRGRMAKFHPRTLTHLLSCLPSGHGPLLPNIKELSWLARWDDGEFLLQVLPFISRSVNSLRIGTEGEPPAATPSCQMLCGLAGRPDLRLSRLDIAFDMSDDPELPPAAAALLEAQSYLRELKIEGVQVGPQGPIALALPSLRCLRKLDADLTCATSSELEDFLARLSAGCPFMEDFDVGILVSGMPRMLPFQTISPLLKAKNLRKLQIQVAHGISIADADIVKMGGAWAQMRDLHVVCSIPISSLSTYARSFSYTLRSLVAKLTFPQPPTFDSSTPTFPSLRMLTIAGDPPQTFLPQIAAYLCWVTPPATEIHIQGRQDWGRVTEMLSIGRHLQDATTSRIQESFQKSPCVQEGS